VFYRTAVFLCIIALSAAAQTPVVRSLPYRCSTFIEGATAFYSARGINISAVNPLSDVGSKQPTRGRYAMNTRAGGQGVALQPLLDASGNPIKSTREAMRSYTMASEHKSKFPNRMTFDSFQIRGGTLEVETENEACRVSLLHDYIVQWIRWTVIFPSDDGPGFPESNGRLEREYLVAIERQLSGPASHARDGTILTCNVLTTLHNSSMNGGAVISWHFSADFTGECGSNYSQD
jgi:hypothetical protein